MPPTTKLSPPAVSGEILLDFPQEHVLLITLNRPRSLNAFTPGMTDDLRRVLNWFEDEPSLWCVIFTGAGRAFCAGADLKAGIKTTGRQAETGEKIISDMHGFASISRRESKKPFIAAVNGSSFGGGTELTLNCDLVVASRDASFGLPEVKRGVIAIQGGIPRLVRIAGHQLASEMLLLGKTITADDARNRFGFVNAVVAPADVLPTALEFASQIVANSPDSVQSTKVALLLTQRHSNEETLAVHVRSPETVANFQGANIKEGLKAFNEKRSPVWQNAGTRTAKL
ncbi:enoyl-CoA hydratase/carnithine racemase [Mycena rosella]|uniref:Enoyl-CoA hydratase/carnithine racemase n=1 Tax=Mycena rosella TaxID=1033263 RepID=A0AAD7C651_MYCRO|nr:enoyl-CoA hydratase/carnithine racemase [Mycena rosella]